MAEYYFNKLARVNGLEEQLQAESAGTYAMYGNPAADLSQMVCAENDLDVSAHRSRPIDINLVNRADLILCMTTQHKEDLLNIFPHLDQKIFTLKEFGQSDIDKKSIRDPYGKAMQYYREAFEIITGEIRRFFSDVAELVVRKPA